MEYIVAPRAYWKGYLKLPLVSCPVALFPASSEREKISFNQINKKTGNRIRYRGMVALGRVVLTSREHVIALEPRGKGLLGITLRYPYEVRKEDEYFEDIPEEKIPKDMLELASHIVETKSSHFDPEKFEDHYEDALKELLKKKQAGEKIEAPKERAPAKVINLMDALRRSVETERGGSAKRQAPSAKARGSEAERPKKKKSR